MKKLECVIHKIEELPFVVTLIQSNFPKAKVFLLKGDLGAGKTTFVKAFADALSCKDTVQSPTYSIVNEYQSTSGNSIYHFDLYRIKNAAELFDVGFEDYLYSNQYCFIEWFEISIPLLPEDCVRIRITLKGESRVFVIEEYQR